MYGSKEEAALAIDCLNQAWIDGRQVRIDWDYGFKQGRQFGRGKNTGGQVRDEVKHDYEDKDRPLVRPQ
jgi:nuclear cap-binding protein subunit 2